MEINNILFNVENEKLEEIEYYEIVSLEEIIKNNPTFIAFSKEDIYNELYNFFKDKNKVENFIELFYNIIEKQKDEINTKNYIIMSDAFKKDLIEEDVFKFVSSIKKLNKIQYKLGENNKDKLWFALDYNNDEEFINFKALTKTTIDLSNDIYYNILKTDEINIPVIGIYYMVPKCTDDDYLNTKIISHLYKKEKLEEIKKENITSYKNLIKKAKPILPLEKIENNNELDYSNLKAFLNKYDINLDFLNIEDTEKIKELLIKYLSNDKEIKEIKYNYKNNKIINLTNNKFTYYDILKKIILLLDITINSKEEYSNLILKLNEQKNSTSLIYNNINDIINSTVDIEEIIENIREFKKNTILENNINTLIDYKNIDIEIIKTLLIKLENDFNKLKLNYKDIYEIYFDFEKEENEIKKGTDIKNYEGILIKNENNYEEFKYADDDIYININEDNKNILNKYYNTYIYQSEHGFIELIKIILPIINQIYEISNISLNFDLLCNMLFNKYRGISTKNNIITKMINEKKIISTNEYINNIAKILPKNVLKIEDDGDPINIILKNANNEYIDIIKESIYISLIWWSIEIQNDINNELFLFNENKLYIPSISFWNLYGYPYKIDGNDGVLIYIISILEHIYKENNLNYENENDYNLNDYIVSLPDNIIKFIKKYAEDNFKNELKNIREYKIDKKNKKEIGKDYQKKLVASITNKKYDKILDEYINALLYLPSVKYEKIHKYLLGCCLQKIDKNFKSDTDLIGVRNDLIAMKKTYSKNREINKPRYLKYHPTLINDIEEKENKIKIKKIDEIKEELYFNNNFEKYLKEIKGKNILLPDLIIDDILLNPKKINNYIEKNINLLINTSTNKKGLLELFNNNNNISINYKNILISVKIILFKNLKDNKDILDLCIFSIDDILNKINIIKSFINDDNKNEIINMILYIISRSLCLPSNPDECLTNILKPLFEIKQNIIINISKDIYLMINKIIKSYDILTLEKQIEFINKIREENKNIALSTMNKMTDDERNINKELKKLGIKNLPNDDDDKIDIIEEENRNDDDIEEEGEEDFEIDKEDDSDIEDLSLDRQEFGFIYAD